MSISLKSVGAITIFVEDPQRSKPFYEKVFDAPAVFEDDNSVVFKFDNTIVNLLARREAHALIDPAQVASAGAGSSFQLTIWVDDVDAVCADLTGRGVHLLNGPIDRPWGIRTAAFADPAGHVWEIAAPLGENGH